jgi:hypothetical protein
MDDEVFIDGYRLVLTCGACPEQYDVFYQDEPIAYLRLRHGSFYASCPDHNGYVVYEASPNGDGMFDEDERVRYLREAIKAVDDWRLSMRLKAMFDAK